MYLRMLPNAEHEMVGHGLSSPQLIWDQSYFYMAVNKDWEIPEIYFNRADTVATMGLELTSNMPLD